MRLTTTICFVAVAALSGGCGTATSSPAAVPPPPAATLSCVTSWNQSANTRHATQRAWRLKQTSVLIERNANGRCTVALDPKCGPRAGLGTPWTWVSLGGAWTEVNYDPANLQDGMRTLVKLRRAPNGRIIDRLGLIRLT